MLEVGLVVYQGVPNFYDRFKEVSTTVERVTGEMVSLYGDMLDILDSAFDTQTAKEAARSNPDRHEAIMTARDRLKDALGHTSQAATAARDAVAAMFPEDTDASE